MDDLLDKPQDHFTLAKLLLEQKRADRLLDEDILTEEILIRARDLIKNLTTPDEDTSIPDPEPII